MNTFYFQYVIWALSDIYLTMHPRDEFWANNLPFASFDNGFYGLSKEGWDSYTWVPANFSGNPKPTWEEFLQHAYNYFWRKNRQSFLDELYNLCRKKICQLYDGKDLHDEIYNRKRGENNDNPEMITDILRKDRMKRFYETRYHQAKNWINTKTDIEYIVPFPFPTTESSDLSVAPIIFNFTDRIWAPDWTPPDGAVLSLTEEDQREYASAPTFHNIKAELSRRKKAYDGDLAEQLNRLLTCVIDCGTDTSTWTPADREHFSQTKIRQNSIRTLNQRAEELKAMTPVPDDYYEDKYWQASPYVRPDIEPDPFIFAMRTDVSLGEMVISNAITVAGINTATPISIEGGVLIVDGQDFSGETVTEGQTVAVRVTAASQFAQIVVATVTIGGVTGEFSVQTVSSPRGEE